MRLTEQKLGDEFVAFTWRADPVTPVRNLTVAFAHYDESTA